MRPLHDELREVFGPDGWLVSRGGHHLTEQLQYALSVADWLTGSRNKPLALIEGETGTGKTLGYLFPVVLHWLRTGEKTVIATHTIALQKQLLEGDIQTVDDYLVQQGVPLPRYSQRLGMRHFVDPGRVAQFLEADPSSNELADLLEWAVQSADSGTGLIDEWTELYGPLPEGVDADAICLTQGSLKSSNQAYDAHKSQAKDADIVLTSHMMVLLEALSGRPILELGDETFTHLLFDEADQIPASADPLSNRRTQPLEIIRELERLIGRGSSALDQKLIQSIRAITDVNRQLQILGHSAHSEEVLLDDERPLGRKANVLLNLLQEECGRIAGAIQRSSLGRPEHDNGQVHVVRGLLNRVCQFNRDQKSSEFGVHALAWSPVRKIPALMYQRANPAFFVSNLWRNLGQRVCFTSATLGAATVDNATEYFVSFKASLAITRDLICTEAQYAPRSFGSLSMVLADTQASRPLLHAEDEEGRRLNARWLDYTASMVTTASDGGPTLVLAASYAETAQLGKKLSAVRPIIHRKGESLQDAIEEFRRGNSQVLITPAAWQGISIRGEDGSQLIRQLVITRIPFLPPNPTRDRLAMAIAEKQGYLTPSQAKSHETLTRRSRALIKLRQGIGRLIRHRNDEGTLWIADPRFPLPGTAVSNRFFIRAIPARFYPVYDQARLFTASGHIRAAKKDIPAPLQEFVNL